MDVDFGIQHSTFIWGCGFMNAWSPQSDLLTTCHKHTYSKDLSKIDIKYSG
jgi:hypothetical protein